MGNSGRRKFVDSLTKMNSTTWLSLALAVVTFATSALSAEPRVVCYYTNWSVYRPGTARFNPQNINPYLCTHLVYAFGGFTKDNTLKPFDKYQDIEKGGYAKFTGLKTYNKNLKTLLAIGGWNEGSSRFSPMVASKERRKEFVRNAIKFLRQNHFDGLDLDWEYPAFRDGGKPKDRENYAKLVKELREEFEREAEKTGKPRLLLTMAVPAGIEYIQKGFDVKTLNHYLDWMNLLTYDYHSAFEPAANHHAPLYPLEEPNEYSVDNELNIDYTIKFYLEQGADRDKLVLGIPTYGRSYTLFNPDAVEIGSPADGPGEQGDATREKGYLAYYEICEALKPKEPKKKRASNDDDDDDDEDSEEEEEDQPWTVMHPNPNAMGPVAYKGNQWVGYDDTDIVKKKAEYVAENGLGGIMFWSIDNDDFRGACHGKPYPLIEAAKEAYILKLGSTDNAIVTDRPRSGTTARSGGRRRNRPKASTTTTARPSTSAKSSSRKSNSVSSTTPAWNIITPEPPTTPDPGSDFKCTDEGFFQHPRDCKKYFWCLDSGPSNLGIVAHQFTCPSGLFFNKAADSCDFARNVLCKKPSATTKAPVTKPASTTTSTSTTTKRPVKLSTKSSALFRTTSTSTTTPEPESEEEYEDEPEDTVDIDAEDPKVIKELIDLIKKVGGVEQLEKHLHLSESSSKDEAISTTSSPINKKLYQKVLERTRGRFTSNALQGSGTSQNSRRGPQNAGLEPDEDRDKILKKDRPQYTTINRGRPSTPQPLDEALEEEVDDAPQQLPRARAVVEESKVGTTAKPLQYVNIRRARPTVSSTSDTADDTASRNALFERQESYVTVSESANNLDIASARRENIPEYVTIRRQRPTTEEATTVQYQNTEPDEDSQETNLEREISSPVSEVQTKYTSIVRSRPTTLTPEEPSTPEPTTVLAVQISSLLNAPNSSEDETPDTTVADTTEAVMTEAAITTTSTTTTSSTTTSTTSAPSTASTRRAIRRRGSTTTTQAPAVSSTTQGPKRPNFLRRTKPTSSTSTVSPSENTTTTEASTKYTRRGVNRFKSRKTEENGGKDASERRPSWNNAGTRSERPVRNFARRRLGGATANNTISSTPSSTSTVTSTLSPSSSSLTVTSRPSSSSPTVTSRPSSSSPTVTSRRPFRVASRRRPVSSTTTTTTEEPTTAVLSEEYQQEMDENADNTEDPTLGEQTVTSTNRTKTRRPLLLKEETLDQNPSATNEDERKRQSKKYSASIKKNQLDEVLKRAKSKEEFDTSTTESLPRTTVDDYSAETALAIATHQLLSAPPPSVPHDYDEKPSSSKKPSTEYKYSTITDKYTETPLEYSSTPFYKTSNQEYDTSYTESLNSLNPRAFSSTTYSAPPSSTFSSTAYNDPITSTFSTSAFSDPKTSTYSSPYTAKVSKPAFSEPKTSTYSSPYTAKVSKPAGFSTPEIITLSQTPSTLSTYTPSSSVTPRFSSTFPVPDSVEKIPSTSRYLPKLIPVPVEDYSYSTGGYSDVREPSFFTREYLLESPVTKTYDDEYQYLSPVTTPQTTTRQVPKKTVHKKISTTLRPTPAPYVPSVTLPTPRRVPSRKPFEKVPFEKVQKPEKIYYKPDEEYDYYDEGDEKIAQKYEEGTKVVLHGKGTIECLDIGNFPHPTSCKKFISCARLENGSLLGWEYICPKGLSFDPVGGICNWSAGLGCDEKDELL